MITIKISLPDEQAERLQDLAIAAGTTREALIRAVVEEWLERPGKDFSEAATFVLRKNAELYWRLA